MGEADDRRGAAARPVAGPSLPPHLIARSSDGGGTNGGSEPAATIGPTLPPHLRTKREEEEEENGGKEADTILQQEEAGQHAAPPPPKRVMGPALPPSREEAEPKLSAAAQAFLDREKRMKEAADREAAGLPPIEQTSQQDAANASRPEWMMAPPTAQSFADTLQKDPTAALKGRGFSQAQSVRVQRGKGGTMGGIGEEDTSLWTETPQEREKRLRDEELGIIPKAGNINSEHAGDQEEQERRRLDLEREARVREAIREHEAKRGPSLLEQHQSKRREELKGRRDEKKRDHKESSKRSRRDDSDSDRDRDRDRDRRRSDKYHSSSSSKRRDEEDESRSRHKDRRRHRDSESDSSSEEEARKRRHKDKDHKSSSSSSRDKHRHHHHHRSHHHSSSRSDDKEADERRREKEKEREKKQKRKDREREEREEKKGAPMMVWDREAALSVGGKLLDDSKRMETIRSAAGLGSRFGSGSTRYL